MGNMMGKAERVSKVGIFTVVKRPVADCLGRERTWVTLIARYEVYIMHTIHFILSPCTNIL